MIGVMRPSIYRTVKSSNRGFTLFEVLISMAVVAFALLHSLALTVRSLQLNQSAQFRTQAVVLSGDIVERMEANNPGAFNRDYVVSADSTISNSPNCLNTTCTSAQLAQFDLAQWKQAIANRFPGGKGGITANVSGDAVVYTITITWLDRRSKTTYATSGSQETFSYVASKIIYNKV